jgi:hypothetical protein
MKGIVGVGAVVGALTHVVPTAGWITIGVIALASLGLLWWALRTDQRAARLAQVIHGSRRRR